MIIHICWLIWFPSLVLLLFLIATKYYLLLFAPFFQSSSHNSGAESDREHGVKIISCHISCVRPTLYLPTTLSLSQSDCGLPGAPPPRAQLRPVVSSRSEPDSPCALP
uniref:Uncharacterized protein n=1 Tax=Scophthalmus maximus TaxID=52904 RepID=A0A8D2ZTL5_SCOMX